MNQLCVEIIGGIVGGLVVILLIAFERKYCPTFKQCLKNRAYTFNVPRSIKIGKSQLSINLEIKSARDVSRLSLTFKGSKTPGHASGHIINFQEVNVSDMSNLPYQSSIECVGSQVVLNFEPFRSFQQGDNLNLIAIVDAKVAWKGRLVLEAKEECGDEINISRGFMVVQPTSDTLGSEKQ